MNDPTQSSLLLDDKIPKPKDQCDTSLRERMIDPLICVCLVVASLTVYLRTLCPTIFTDDCGEIATAVATGGVIHPPGYPLYTLLGQLFIGLIHTGEPAWRLGLLSSIAGSLSVALSYILARRLGAGRVWPAIGAITFAFSVSLWQQATKVETYTLNALLISLVWNCAARYDDSPSLKRLAQASLCFGFALTNHLTAICAIAGGLVLIVSNLRRSTVPILGSITTFLILSIAPLSLYAFLWFNAAEHPNGQVWGDPSNWRGLYLHLTGARYHPYFASQNGLDMAQRDLVNLPAILWHNMGPLLIAVVPGVARALWVDDAKRRLGLALLVSLACYLLETTVYGILNIFEYYTPVVLMLCVFGAVGGDAVLRGVKNLPSLRFLPKAPAISACLLALTLIGAPLVHWQYCDRSNATFMRDMALNTLQGLPKNAVIITTGDNRVFPMWYAQDVLGYRRDVAVIPRHAMDTMTNPDGILMMSWLVRKLGAEHPEVVQADEILQKEQADPEYARREGPTWDIAVRALSQNYSLFMTDPLQQDTHMNLAQLRILNPIGPDLILSSYGLAEQIIPQRSYPNVRTRYRTNLALWKQMHIEHAQDALMADEPDGNITNLSYVAMLNQIADLASKSGSYADAYQAINQSISLHADASNYDRLAFICGCLRRPAEAMADLKIAVRLAPDNDAIRQDLHFAQESLANPPMPRIIFPQKRIER